MIRAALDNPDDPNRYKKIGNVLSIEQSDEKNIRLIDDMQDDLANVRKIDSS